MPLQDDSLPVPLADAVFNGALTSANNLLSVVMPLLRHFTPEAIARFTKYGEKSDAFVQEADAAVSAVGDDLPPAFNAQNFHDMILVMHQLDALLGPLSQLFDGLSDAKMLVGSFLMQNGNFIYAQLKQVQNIDPRVVPYVEEMGKRYKAQGVRHPVTPPA